MDQDETAGIPPPDTPVAENVQLRESNPSWERVQLARHPKRPQSRDYIDRLITGFEELHGDRFFGDDKSMTRWIRDTSRPCR